MPEHLGPLGHDPDWYDKGPGSEAFKREVARNMREHADELHKQRLRESRIVKTAKAASKAHHDNTHLQPSWVIKGLAHEVCDCELCRAVRGEEKKP